jgi:hypothetical protein
MQCNTKLNITLCSIIIKQQTLFNELPSDVM